MGGLLGDQGKCQGRGTDPAQDPLRDPRRKGRLRPRPSFLASRLPRPQRLDALAQEVRGNSFRGRTSRSVLRESLEGQTGLGALRGPVRRPEVTRPWLHSRDDRGRGLRRLDPKRSVVDLLAPLRSQGLGESEPIPAPRARRACRSEPGFDLVQGGRLPSVDGRRAAPNPTSEFDPACAVPRIPVPRGGLAPGVGKNPSRLSP